MNNQNMYREGIYTTEDRENDGYEHLLVGVRKSFDEIVNGGIITEPLFTTDVENLYDIFLDNLPAEARQHYNCNACRNFVNRYGGLVTIDEDGRTYPVMWKYDPPFFADAIGEVRTKVAKAKVTGVFITSEKRLGMPKTGVWHHMAVDVPKTMIHKDRLRSAYQVSAEKAEDYRMLRTACLKYKVGTVETAVNILRSDAMYRGDKLLGIAEWFLGVLKKFDGKKLNQNKLWKIAATAPAGFCHVSSSMIGTLLDDIEDGNDFETIKRKFNEKMNPLKYQRPQVAPSAGNVAQAEKIIAKLGMENSLKRRFARLDEIKTIWTPTPEKPKSSIGGIFADLKTKENESKKTNDIQAPATTMTWEKFNRTVLPMAKKIELFVESGIRNGYSALVTAEDFDAPPIIKWDTEEKRNPFNWYVYSGGSLPSHWNLPSGYVEVTAVTLQPNLWQPGYISQGQGVFFILKDCVDLDNTASALFPETLINDLREIRSTIEAYSTKHKLSGKDEASACGLCLQAGPMWWNCILRVTTDVGVSRYKLDRWD